MSEDETNPQSVPPPDVPTSEAPPAAAAAEPRPRFRDRVFGLRAVAAVAVASVLIGGAGGAALGARSNGHDDDRNGRFGGPMTNFRGPSGMDGNQMPPGMQGQLPPALPPSQDDGSDS